MITVVLPAYDAWATLPAVMESLRSQVERSDRELVLVESSGVEDAQTLEGRWPWARVVCLSERALPGAARNLAVAQTSGDLIAFIDADALPEPGWLDELERGMGPNAEAVAGAVLNGTPSSAPGTAGYLLEFAEWNPWRRGLPLHGATCNLLIRREAFERTGGFRPDLWPGEDTVLTIPIAESGRLAFAPSARVRHFNRTRFGEFIRHQLRLGSSYAEVCADVDFPGRKWGRLPLAPASGLLRIPWLWRRLRDWSALPHRPLTVWPAVCVGSCAWGIGVTVGALRRSVKDDRVALSRAQRRARPS